ncbi:MAG TPA: hypothetical protein VM260_14090, partial [Pirellula sp.]|nr:hypothetical protein [Pirellula sp.]
MNLLVIEASHDSVTSAAHNARRAALKTLASGKGHALIELFGANATKANAEQSWYKITGTFGLVSGMGHGSPTEFTGHNDIAIFQSSNRQSVYSGAIVHLFSCNCGQTLGPAIANNGAKAFVGYTDFVSMGSKTSLDEHFVAEAAAIDIAIRD